MDESLQELEAELKALQLRSPSFRLQDRIGHELAPGETASAPARRTYSTATNLSSWKWFGWRTAALAAACAVVAAITFVRLAQPRQSDAPAVSGPVAAVQPQAQTHPVSTVQPERYQPVAASNVLYDLKDEGPATLSDDTPARRLRYRYLDTYTWKNPRGNGSLKWSVPREEVRVIPASMN